MALSGSTLHTAHPICVKTTGDGRGPGPKSRPQSRSYALFSPPFFSRRILSTVAACSGPSARDLEASNVPES